MLVMRLHKYLVVITFLYKVQPVAVLHGYLWLNGITGCILWQDSATSWSLKLFSAASWALQLLLVKWDFRLYFQVDSTAV